MIDDENAGFFKAAGSDFFIDVIAPISTSFLQKGNYAGAKFFCLCRRGAVYLIFPECDFRPMTSTPKKPLTLRFAEFMISPSLQ
jgi:hypothetical protein